MGIFSNSLRKNIERVLSETNYKLTNLAYNIFSRAIIRSPHVGQGPYVAGHFINNWFPAINGYDSSTTSVADPDGAGSVSRLSLVKGSKAFFKKDGFITLSNNLDYAHRVEYTGWPKGYDQKTGWNWTGQRMIYAPVQYAFQDIKAQI